MKFKKLIVFVAVVSVILIGTWTVMAQFGNQGRGGKGMGCGNQGTGLGPNGTGCPMMGAGAGGTGCPAAGLGPMGKGCGAMEFGGMGAGCQGVGFILKGLNMTDTQKTDIAGITAKYKDTLKQLADTSFAKKEALKNVMFADTYNESEIRQAFQDASAARLEITVLKAKIFSEIKALLTPEQIETLNKKRTAFIERQKTQREFNPNCPLNCCLDAEI